MAVSTMCQVRRHWTAGKAEDELWLLLCSGQVGVPDRREIFAQPVSPLSLALHHYADLRRTATAGHVAPQHVFPLLDRSEMGPLPPRTHALHPGRLRRCTETPSEGRECLAVLCIFG